MEFTESDHKWMREALHLAQKGRGYVSPNPLVGCVVVNIGGEKIGQGWHERYGQAHAEVNAIESVSDRSELVDATVYVSLEPCSHQGKTPPCADFLAKLPIKRVVIAMKDPNPKVDGKGIRRLKKAGISVESGLLEEEARELNEIFIHNQGSERPFVMLKIAQTLDGYVAARNGDSKWVTAEQARAQVHQWRASYDAVMVGRNTALNDNPQLTVRLVEGRQPFRVVVDGDFSLPETLNLFSDQYEEKTIRLTCNKDAFQDKGDPMLSILKRNYFRGKNLLIPKKEGHVDLKEGLKELRRHGIYSVLVEPGRSLATALIKADLVDKVAVFIAPKILGGGINSVLGLSIERMDEALPLYRSRWKSLGQDLLFTGYF